ncbi:hybrid sensor histidine kinase/response regulator [Lignipirellula cremea]|uniref:histidine kinase n=1 Tax=Lignipirellula cremea TaxID=2528010 RepID=A0A518DMW7_9BACT|nr:response regulator [Lignipirellula cremea]QDU93186.1 Sensor histidine kinase LiaS [Lignipirellula cremea]
MDKLPINILAIDDNPYAIRLIREILSGVRHLQFEMRHEQRLSLGLRALEEETFDLILLDLTLPDSFGLDTFDDFLKPAAETPIVILTNADDDSLALEAVRRGAQDYLVKNQLDGRLLARAIRYAIERQAASVELKSLQQEVTDMALREQRRIGQQLHDGLGQHLTGVALMAKSLQRKLEGEQSAATDASAELVELIVEAQGQVRALVKGLYPVDVDAEGLRIALQQLAQSTIRTCGVSCSFDSEERVSIENNNTATQLFHIAQEAVNNAVKHGNARHIAIRLDSRENDLVLIIRDDGCGLPAPAEEIRGMGMQIMQYRANSIGASIEFASQGNGVSVVCRLRHLKTPAI